MEMELLGQRLQSFFKTPNECKSHGNLGNVLLFTPVIWV